jgi:hypothetical protein
MYNGAGCEAVNMRSLSAGRAVSGSRRSCGGAREVQLETLSGERAPPGQPGGEAAGSSAVGAGERATAGGVAGERAGGRVVVQAGSSEVEAGGSSRRACTLVKSQD